MLPLTQDVPTSILARVCYALIKADYKKNPEAYDNPVTAIIYLADRLARTGFPSIVTLLEEAAMYCSAGGKLADWRMLHDRNAVARHMALARLGRKGRKR